MVATTAPTTAKKTTEFAIEIAPQLVKVRRTLVRALATPIAGWWDRGLRIRAGHLGLFAVGRLVAASSPPRIVQIEHAPDAARQSGTWKGA
jgi:hypothetical protein